jgi:enoyl-CoA hydratase
VRCLFEAAVSDVLYEVTGRLARLTLNRPGRGNGITRGLLDELEHGVERADLDPKVHVILLAGAGKGFCGGYDLVESAESVLPNHDPTEPWDPMLDYAMMSRNVRSFMSLQRCSKPVLCKVHGFCVAGGTDLALCADLLVIAADAKIGYPPARVWGSPTTALWTSRLGPQRAKRLLFTGDSLSGAEAAEWGLAIEAPVAEELDGRVESLCARIARLPVNQLRMMKLLVNQSSDQPLASTQVLGTLLDGVARHTEEGYAFQALAMREGFKEAVRQRDEPFGDLGPSTFKG